MITFKDIPKFTRDANYRVNVSWDYLETWIERHQEGGIAAVDLDPPFQRAHVWTEDQQRRYVEFMLKGGQGSNELRFNCTGWMGTFEGPFVLVDGKQRMEAVRKWLRDDLKTFGQYCSDFGKQPVMGYDFIIMINELKTKAEVLQWYLDLNSGGTVHTEEELEKVRTLLRAEEAPTW